MVKRKRYYIVGIDGRNTPDPDYWFDRWETIEAESESVAIEKWIEMRVSWIRKDELHLIKIFAVLDEYIPAYTWIRKHIKKENI